MLLFVGGTTACGGEGTAGTASTSPITCDAREDTGGMCMQYFEPLDDTRRLSILANCRESGGRLVDRCPTADLVGVCEVQEDTTRAWSLNARTLVHHYLHGDLRTPSAVTGIAGRCAGPTRTWTPAGTSE